MTTDNAVADAANKGKNFFLRGGQILVNQFHPFGKDGHLGRTLLIVGGFAALGATAGAAGLLGPGALTVSAPAAGSAGFWGSAGNIVSSFGAHSWNGVGYAFGGGYDFITGVAQNADWSGVGDHLGGAVDALNGGGEQSSIINTNFDNLMQDTYNLNPADMLGQDFASASSGAINTTMDAATNPNVIGQIGMGADQYAHPALTAA